MVHNGIIENFIALKEELLQKGYTFRSETDTEVVAQLLDYYYSDCGDFFEAMNRLLHAVDGAYALGIICADYPDRLVAARKDAPLLLGFGDGENFIASDVTALIRHTRDIAYMDDGELAILSRSGIRVYDRQLRPVEKKHHHVDWEVDAAEKGATPTSCSRRSWSSLPPSARPPPPGSREPRGASGPDHDPGADPGHRPHLHRGLRLVVPCGHGGQV